MEQIALHTHWPAANRKMVAKLISELAYEQAFKIEQNNQGYVLSLDDGVCYQFLGKTNIWGQIVIEPTSLIRKHKSLNSDVLVTQFMIDIQRVINISDESLAEHFEDLNATLLGDCKLAQRKMNMSANELAFLSCEQQQLLFNGHPKFAFNKGRRGWGIKDLSLYAPEAERAFQLTWVAVHKSILEKATNNKVDWKHLVLSAVTNTELHVMNSQLSSFNVDSSEYTFVPVHPWQWEQKLSILFSREIAEKTLVYLGEFGDDFLPQLSIRTLSNVTRPESYDIKLPLTIMNTSCYRGIPGRYILAGPIASDWLDSIFKSDPLFVDKKAEVLQEPAAGFVAQSDYKRLTDAPYRYHELLGVIWRESAQSKLGENESAILMAALMESDEFGVPLISEYIQASGLSIEAWLDKLFDAVVIPFYHLLCKYGVSLIAHGQNVTLVMEDGVPKRILLKDFQGDMRLVERDIPEQEDLEPLVKEVTVKLPEELIIHDLQTGHFVTVLRFISPLVDTLGLSEIEFYRVLAQRVHTYMAMTPEYKDRFERLDLFKPRILRIGLNLAKFRHSTDSSASRMLPDMDDKVDNPLYIALNQ
ncbi:IucA/IucC family protein [Aliivibrio fischeri]|uniref:IucA/IucC family siderophore biosynthesis protein n=1 Tax=Aliivibrio fischeri TaxID=668 RepID=A0A844P1U7_ALIFS|nr:IucA/IucC family siderophore biosynthesis protein [Aliivibrio fischeri]MUK49295.1 IucA/IucC family siderophore biosynthesis protein [Aliivibrio fischeri]MUK66768.1 IucA/IucC family siderophore biosynthesis protein [Aliivibrio fischeri]